MTNDTLCIMCVNMCRDGCKWARNLEPVDGWTAEKTNHGYFVKECPEFIRETAETILPDDINEEGAMRLLEAVAEQMREDYVNGRGPKGSISANRKAIEKWLLDGQGKALMNLSDPEAVVKELREMARIRDNARAKWGAF